MSTPTTRAVVTGLGIVAPNGTTVEQYWAATLAGNCAIAPLPGEDFARYPARNAGQVSDFDAAARIPGRLLVQTDRVTRLALAAAEEALADAGADTTTMTDYDLGVVTANACGGFEFTHQEIRKLWTEGPERVSVYESFAWFYAVNTGQISIRHKMRGPSGVIVTEQAGGLDALGQCRRSLRQGTRLILGGGLDSAMDPWSWVLQHNSRISTHADPGTAFLPFDARATGYVPGEGGAILVVEDIEAARARGASHSYGEITGYAATVDPRPGSDRPAGLTRAVRLALADAGLRPEDIDVVFADCAGVTELDRAEASTIEAVFGPHGVAVAAPKALVGRLYAGGGALDAATALLSMRDGVIPPCGNQLRPDPSYALDLVTNTPRTAELRHCLVLARGAGGFNAALVLSATDPETPTGGSAR